MLEHQLFVSVGKRDLSTIGTLLQMGANPNELCREGYNAVHLAAGNGRQECLEMLLDYGQGDVNLVMDHTGDTALHLAAQQGRGDCVQICLTRGADAGQRNNLGVTAADVVKRKHWLRRLVSGPDAAQYLKQHVRRTSGPRLERLSSTSAGPSPPPPPSAAAAAAVGVQDDGMVQIQRSSTASSTATSSTYSYEPHPADQHNPHNRRYEQHHRAVEVFTDGEEDEDGDADEEVTADEENSEEVDVDEMLEAAAGTRTSHHRHRVHKHSALSERDRQEPVMLSGRSARRQRASTRATTRMLPSIDGRNAAAPPARRRPLTVGNAREIASATSLAAPHKHCTHSSSHYSQCCSSSSSTSCKKATCDSPPPLRRRKSMLTANTAVAAAHAAVQKHEQNAVKLQEMLECSICLDTMTDPVTLACGHNFCKPCLQALIVHSNDEDCFNCPIDRYRFPRAYPLRTSITLQAILDMVQHTPGYAAV